MTHRNRAGRRGFGAAAGSAAMLISGVLAGCAPPPGLKSAWHSYVAAEADYEACRNQPHRPPSPCAAEKAAYQAARDRYHAEANAVAPAGR